MRQFLIQFQKDFTSYFNGLTAYIIIGAYYILSFFSALYLGDYFLRESNVMNAYFIMQPFVLILIIPAITMRSWSEEIKSGTIELLLTQPLSYPMLVLSKHCAAFVFFLFLVSFSIPFLIISVFLSIPDWGVIWSSYCGLVLCGVLFTAAGCLISTFCRNNIISFICTVFALFFISQLKFTTVSGSYGSLPFDAFNFSKNYEAFLTGSLVWGNIVYFVVGTALLLWLNSAVLTYKYNNRGKPSLFKVFSLLIFFIFLTSVLSAFLLFQNIIDITDNRVYTLSPQNKNYLNTLNKRIDITLYEAKSKREETNSGYAAYANFVERFLQQIQLHSYNAVRYSVIRVEPFSSMERRLVNENIPYEEDAFGNKIYMALDISDNTGNNFRINSLNNLRQNFLEADFMRLIRFAGQDKKNIAVVANKEDLDNMQGFSHFLDEFYEVTYLNFSLQYLPSTYDAVIVINPQDVTIEFLLALDQYILNGGNIAMFDEPEFIQKKADTYLVDFLGNYGIKPVPEEFIMTNVSTLGVAQADNSQWKDIRFVLINGAGEVNFRKSPIFTVSPVLMLNDKTTAVLSEGKYVTHFPEISQMYTDVLEQSDNIGKFVFIYDSDLIKDYLYIAAESKGRGFYQVVPLADNTLFYMQLLDKITGSNLEKGLTYRRYPMNLTGIGNFLLNTQKKRQNAAIAELQKKIDGVKNELNATKNFSVQNMGHISKLTQDLEEAEDKLNASQQQVIQNYHSAIMALTATIIFIIPAILLCCLALCIHLYRKYKYAKIRRLSDDIQTY